VWWCGRRACPVGCLRVRCSAVRAPLLTSPPGSWCGCTARTAPARCSGWWPRRPGAGRRGHRAGSAPRTTGSDTSGHAAPASGAGCPRTGAGSTPSPPADRCSATRTASAPTPWPPHAPAHAPSAPAPGQPPCSTPPGPTSPTPALTHRAAACRRSSPGAPPPTPARPPQPGVRHHVHRPRVQKRPSRRSAWRPSWHRSSAPGRPACRPSPDLGPAHPHQHAPHPRPRPAPRTPRPLDATAAARSGTSSHPAQDATTPAAASPLSRTAPPPRPGPTGTPRPTRRVGLAPARTRPGCQPARHRLPAGHRQTGTGSPAPPAWRSTR
jgi:hypothetical protein